MIRLFVGYDPREALAYHAFCQSVIENTSTPVAITPIARSMLKDIFTRPKAIPESTEFSISRFLVPYLSNYEGWSIFMDCDMIVQCDLTNLIEYIDDKFSVMCVKHEYEVSGSDCKFLNEKQTRYTKKNWSSMMLFNNARCCTLTPEYVNTASGLDLHQFKWLASDELIGSLALEYNHLVDEPQQCKTEPKILHYTKGGPYFKEYRDCSFSENWFAYYDLLLKPDSRRKVT